MSKFPSIVTATALLASASLAAADEPKRDKSHSANAIGRYVNRNVDVWSDDASLRADPRGAVGAVGVVYADESGHCSDTTRPTFRWEQIILPQQSIAETIESEPVARYVNNGTVSGSDSLPFLDVNYDAETAHKVSIDDRAVYRIKWDASVQEATAAFTAAHPEHVDVTKVCKLIAVKGVVVRRFYYQRYKKVAASANAWVLDGKYFAEVGDERYVTLYGLSTAVVWSNPLLATDVVPKQVLKVVTRKTSTKSAKKPAK